MITPIETLPELAEAAPALAPAIAMRDVRPATAADIPAVHMRLREAIALSPHYNDEFKAYETERFSERFLRGLIDADPWYVTISVYKGGEAGVVIMTPQFGNIWCPWILTFPEFAHTAVGLSTMRHMIRHWDNGRFHKISSLARPDNRAPLVILKRLGFREVARLDNHMFGQDYIQLERALTKVLPGYDRGVSYGRLERLRSAVRILRGA